MALVDGIRKRAGLLAVLVLVMAAAALLLYRLFGQASLPEGLIQANGRIEGDRVIVASKFPGRIAKLLAREGDDVAAGQVLAQLEDDQALAKVNQARAARAALAAQVRLAAAKEEQTRRDAERFRGLLREGTASPYEAEQAELAWKVTRDQLAATRAEQRHADAALAEAGSVLADLTIKAPAAGTVTTRMVEAGAVVAAGAPLFSLVDLDHLYLKVYLPEVDIGKVRLDLPARIYTDAFPDQPFTATVRYIASEAEFTPKEVQTADERVKLVYAVKLYLARNPGHRLTPGLPADAVIRWKEDVPWEKPRW